MSPRRLAPLGAGLLAAGLLAATLLGAGLLGGCSSSHQPSASHADRLLVRAVPGHVTVTTRTQPGLGAILTDHTGHALYMYPPDARSRVTCTGPCAGTWPALTITAHQRPRAAGKAHQQLLGTVRDPNTGARAVTYAGNPLYRYAGDLSPGTAHGQALFLDGGPWYVLDAAGNPLTQTPSPATVGADR